MKDISHKAEEQFKIKTELDRKLYEYLEQK